MKPFLPVLAYQKIGKAPGHSAYKNQWTSVKELETMLAFLHKYGYTFITPADLKKPLPVKPILLAFFGGYQSIYTDVFPLLQKYRACATVFVAAGTLGTYNFWQPPYREPWQNILTASQLKELVKSKRVQVGTLGLSGHNLLACEDTSRAREEILESIHRLHALYKLDVCAVGFWPGIPNKKAAHTAALVQEIGLPVITSLPGVNAQTEPPFLRLLRPGLFTTFLLWASAARTCPKK